MRTPSVARWSLPVLTLASCMGGCSSTPETVPNVDLAGAEEPVVARIGTLRDAVLVRPDSAAAWGRLAMSLQAHGFVDAALDSYSTARSLQPGNFAYSYLPALLLGTRGDPRAGSLFDAARDLRPDYAPLLLREADWLLGQGRPEAAYELLDGSAALRDAAAQAELLLGRAARAEGDTARAHRHFDAAIEAAPRYGEAHAQLAETYRLSGDSMAAELARERARLFEDPPGIDDPVYAEVVAEGVSSRWHILRGQARLGGGNAGEAVEEFRAAAGLLPDDAHVQILLGSAYEADGRTEEAAAAYHRAVELRPGYVPAELNLARAEYRSGAQETARNRARRAVASDSTIPDGYLLLGMFAEIENRPARAAELYVEGLRRAPFDPRIAIRAAWIFATSRDPNLRRGQLAAALAEKVSKLEGYREPAHLDVLAAAYAEYGAWDRAVAIADRALALATRHGADSLAAELTRRRDLYKRREPYRE